MLTKLATPINKLTSSKLWYYIENILVVGLLFYCIKFLTDYDNVYYQTWKNAAAAKAILAFTAIVFIIRKVKLLNWQSLVATLLFGIVVFERLHFWADAEDILNAVKPQLAVEWLSLMIIIDMILYKNVNNIFKGVNYLAILYVLMTIGMIWRRHDRMDPIILIFPMFLFALVKMDEEKTDWFIRRFIDGWFISFIYVMVKSFSEHPYDGSRYYGCFLNIGQFGIFMICCFTVAMASIYYCKEKYGRKSFGYLISSIWILASCYMIYIINTRTTFTGILLCLAFAFLFARKDISKKVITRRLLILLTCLLLLIGGGILLIKMSGNISEEWLNDNNGIFSPIAFNLLRLRKIVNIDPTLTMKEQIFRIIDSFTSGRLSIAKNYSQFFNYDGNTADGFYMADVDYWVYGAHNTYIQILVEYGYLSIIELLLVITITIIKHIRNYLTNIKSTASFFTMLWMASMLGVWLGESNTFFFPISFFGYMFIARTIRLETE